MIMTIKLFTIPNILTLANLACGFTAISFTLLEKDLEMALLFIIIAAVFDFFDGFAARLLKSFSLLGKELDSLADMVSFGIAPSAIVMVMFMEMDSQLAPLAVIIALFSALRLAKFNIDENQTSEFIGLPTPANALFFASIGWMYQNDLIFVTPNQWSLAIMTVVMATALIYNIKMFALKFKSYAIKDNYVRYSFLLGSLITLIIWQISALPLIIMAYICISVFSNLICKMKQ